MVSVRAALPAPHRSSPSSLLTRYEAHGREIARHPQLPTLATSRAPFRSSATPTGLPNASGL